MKGELNMKLIVGDKQSSSWSMRGSLMLQEAGVDYTEIMLGSDWPVKVEDDRIRVFSEDLYGFPSQAASGCCCEITQLKDIAGKGLVESSLAENIHRVPVFVDEEQNIIITDLMAIFEHIEENHLGRVSLLPTHIKPRAEVRVFSYHIYSDFLPLMSWMPYNQSFKEPKKAKYEELPEDAKLQISELLTTIQHILKLYNYNTEDSYLFGDFSLGDIMVAPLAYSFMKWNVPLENTIETYFRNLLNRNIIKDNFLAAEKIYGDKNKYPDSTIQWIANQYRVNPRYQIISHIDSDFYHRLKNKDEFNIFMMAKNGKSLTEIEHEANISEDKINSIMDYFHPKSMMLWKM